MNLGKAKRQEENPDVNNIEVEHLDSEEGGCEQRINDKGSNSEPDTVTEEEDDGWTDERYMKAFGEYEPSFSESDIELEESLKVHVPTLPKYVSMYMAKKFRKIRRVRTSMDGLFLYGGSGSGCVYWPAFHELPKEYPVKEKLREVADSEREFRTIVERYEKYYALYHVYGVFNIPAYDNDHLVNNFKEMLNRVIFNATHCMYFEGFVPGFGNGWKANMIRHAKYHDEGIGGPRKLKTSKLLKKPFIEVKYQEGRRRTDRVGPWKDDPESDPESHASPPRGLFEDYYRNFT